MYLDVSYYKFQFIFNKMERVKGFSSHPKWVQVQRFLECKRTSCECRLLILQISIHLLQNGNSYRVFLASKMGPKVLWNGLPKIAHYKVRHKNTANIGLILSIQVTNPLSLGNTLMLMGKMVDGFDGLQKWRLLYSNQLYIIQKQKLEKMSMRPFSPFQKEEQ
jgi:hypothetical protein